MTNTRSVMVRTYPHSGELRPAWGRTLSTSLLAIYLNDHLAAATGAHELAKRAAASNRDSDDGTFLATLAGEIEADRQSLLELMRALDIGIDRLKVVGGWGAEKLGRLKLNGRVLGYSPLSRVVELEVLALGIGGKLALWHTLAQLRPATKALAEFDLQRLILRAERQLEETEQHRRRASLEAFGSTDAATSAAAS
jgi:hypothetical protein